jgi:hypothetical protein
LLNFAGNQKKRREIWKLAGHFKKTRPVSVDNCHEFVRLSKKMKTDRDERNLEIVDIYTQPTQKVEFVNATPGDKNRDKLASLSVRGLSLGWQHAGKKVKETTQKAN